MFQIASRLSKLASTTNQRIELKQQTRLGPSDFGRIRSGLLVELLPDPEAMGLLALMLLHESRREARVSGAGDIVLLEEQDRSLWNKDFTTEGRRLVEQSLRSRRFEVYTH